MTDLWKGLFKLQEEMGELNLELGKLGPFPTGDHPGGARYADRVRALEDECADVLAAVCYFIDTNKLNAEAIADRSTAKLARYNQWGLTGVPAHTQEPPYGALCSHVWRQKRGGKVSWTHICKTCGVTR